MHSEPLTTYLNDHLAGSVAALELLDHLLGITKGTEREELLVALGGEIEEDQEILRQLLRALGGKESKTRQAAAWLTEKVGEAKLKLDDPGDGQLRLLEALETLELGIRGKLALWRALEVVRDEIPELRHMDLHRLQERADEQHQRVETLRLQTARMAFGSDRAGTSAGTR